MADGQVGDGGQPVPRWRRVWPHLVGVAWVVGAALALLAPALHHGLWLGSYDLLSRSGLTVAPGLTVRNSGNGDQIAEMIPWTAQAWTQVHAGHLPLWNPQSGLGMPLAFNWQSAVFSLPALLSYAVPLHLAYTVQVVVTLLVAGTGAYALARVLRLGVLACATAGTAFELSGSFVGWLGWPHAAVMSWAGWLLALAVLVVRGHHRARDVTALAVVVALMLYAGEPEIAVIVIVALGVMVTCLLIIRRPRTGGWGRRWRHPATDLTVALAAGAALAAPLLLPGMQVLARSTRSSGRLLDQTEVGRALPPHDLVHLLVPGYNGLPVTGSQVFGDAVYTDTLAYVGVIVVALAVLGVIRRRRQPEVLSLTVLGVVTAVVLYLPPVQAVFDHLPLVSTIDWHRALMVLDLCLAVLAGVGMEVLVREASERRTQRVLGVVFAGALLLLGVLRLFGSSGLDAGEAAVRRASLDWPLVTSVAGLLAVVGLAGWTRFHHSPPDRRPRRLSPGLVVGSILLAIETAFLVASGAPLLSSSPTGPPVSSAVTALQRVVGTSTVGFGGLSCYAGPGLSGLGILPEANILYDLHEFDVYDPVLPRGYPEAWSEVSRSPAGVPIFNSFCPGITTAAEARRFGVSFVLVPTGTTGPVGTALVRKVGNEDLYRVPGSGAAELAPVAAGTAPSTAVDGGKQVDVTHPTPASWRLTTDSPVSSTLVLHLTDEPGWHATIDGRPLALDSYAGVMLRARVPAGRHLIELHYWPVLFSVGLVVAAVALVGLVLLAFGRRGWRAAIRARASR